MMYRAKNGTYTVVGTDNCEWSDEVEGWVAPDPSNSGSVVLERIEDGIFFLFYYSDKEKWVGRGIRNGKIDDSREVLL